MGLQESARETTSVRRKTTFVRANNEKGCVVRFHETDLCGHRHDMRRVSGGRDAIRRTPGGVRDVNVNLLTGTMTLELDPNQASSEDVVAAVEHAGYGILSPDATDDAADERHRARQALVDERRREAVSMRRRLIASIVFLVPLMWVAMGPMLGLPLPSF
jgi:cation transport ATPase